MCNLYTQSKSIDEIAALFRDVQIPLTFPEGIPNLQPRDVRITENGPIVRATAGGYELVVRRWSWPGTHGKPVYNFRSDGREFESGRCLIVADGFYEFTKPADPKQKRKDRWLFNWTDGGMVGIAGLTRTVPGLGEAFTMLTTEPGPDIAPYHQRQVAIVPPTDWHDWLDYRRPARDLLKVLPAGSLTVCASQADATSNRA
jgi:putative SOS response-associated peptidase YedK